MSRTRASRTQHNERDRGGRAPPAASPEALLLEWQRSAGNQAVGARLARTKTPEQEFDSDARVGSWQRAAIAFVDIADPAPHLKPIASSGLRLLQDELVRFGSTPRAAAAVTAVEAELVAKGATAASAKAGAAYGVLTPVESPIENGDPATGTPYRYGISFAFLPDLAAVAGADEIAFVQTVRVVDISTGADLEPFHSNKMRQTPTHTSVDTHDGFQQGFYEMEDDRSKNGSLTTWKRADPTTPAWMLDRPRGTVANAVWEFETAVVCSAGADLGTVYATITWGFMVDAAQKIKVKPRVVTNKPTREFKFAVDAWNQQAAGPPADRNAPGQLPLPALK